MRRDCKPHFVDSEGKHIELRRVNFDDRAVGESFLQKYLHKSPAILPVSEIDDSFAPLVSLGREIHSIDNLFISPKGRLILVETKLWRNPEATRQVVAQMIDYAQRLRLMTYEEFEKACQTARQPAPLSTSSLYTLLRQNFPLEVPPEQQFIDAVQKTLRNARFLLLVVGDGIHENLEDMVGLLHQYPQMLFSFALVEMQIYESDAISGRLIVPQLVARTSEIVRAVVQIEGRGEVAVRVSMKPDDGPEKPITLTEKEFLDSIDDAQTKTTFEKLISFAKDIGYVHCATKSVSARMEYGDTGHIRFFRLWSPGIIKFIPLDFQLKKYGVDNKVAWEAARQLEAIFPNVGLKAGKPELSRPLKPSEIAEHFEDFVNVFKQAAEKIKAISPTRIPPEETEEIEEEDREVPGNDGDSNEK